MKEPSAKQLPRNLGMNIVSFLVSMAIGLMLVPYLISHLGVAAYGLIPLAMVFTEYIGLITLSFNGAVSRFLTIEIQRKSDKEAIIIFNSSLWVVMIFCFLQVFISILILYNLQNIISIPEGLARDTLWLFGFTFTGFIISILSSVFSVSMFSSNRLDLMRINDLSRTLMRFITIILFFYIFEPRLIYVGVGNLVGGFVLLTLSLMRWRQLTPELKIDLRKIDFERIKPIAGMAGWIMINTIGYLLFLRIDTYIVNRFLGPEATGEYASVLQWNHLIRTAAGVLSGAVTPLGLIYYARGEHVKLVRLMQLAMKMMGLALAIPIGLLCAFSWDVLAMWLGEDFRRLGELMIIQLCTLVINLGVLPLFAVNTALERVKVPAVLTCLMGGINFFLALWFVLKGGWGYYGVALAGVIVLTMKNAIFTPIYAAHILKLPKLTFFRPLISGGVAFLLIFATGSFLRNWINLQGLLELFLFLMGISILFIFPVLWGGLSLDERTTVVEMAPVKFRNLCRKVLFVVG